MPRPTHRCPDCGEPCDCQTLTINGCSHCELEDDIEPIGDEMEDDDEDED